VAVSLAPIQPLDLILPLERVRIPKRDREQGRASRIGRGLWRFSVFTRSGERFKSRSFIRALI